MDIGRRAFLSGLLAAAFAGPGRAFGQAGYPPPAPGQAPPGFDSAPQQHFEIQRRQDSERRSFDAFQRGQAMERERNLDTLRRQQQEQRRALDAMRREGREADAARTSPRLQVQGRRRTRPLTQAERRRIDRATRRGRSSSGVPSIIVEEPRRRR